MQFLFDYKALVALHAKTKIPSKKNGMRPSHLNPAKDDELPSTVKQMANYLLCMLCTKYVNKKATIADLNIAMANSRLKEQALKYVKRTYPFDHNLCEGENAIEWWQKLNACHTNDAQLMVVHVCLLCC